MGTKGTCKAKECSGDVRAKGYCDRHYRKWRKGLLAKPRHRTCNETNCRKPRSRKGLCVEHFASKGKKAKEAAAETPAAAPAS